MIFQGLFNILDLYSNEIDHFYNSIDRYFRKKIHNSINEISIEENNLEKTLESYLSFFTDNLIELGFNKVEIESNFLNMLQQIRKNGIKTISSITEFYKKFVPVIYEIFLEKIFDYLIDSNAASIILDFKSKEILPIEFIMELSNLRDLFKKLPEKRDNLRKYLQIKKKIIIKLIENKEKIENIRNFKDPRDKIQFFYMVYRIIDFFGIQKIFDFSQIRAYIKNSCNEWLDTIPLVSLKNPDLYFCGIFLIKELSIPIEEETIDQIKYFLLDIYDENIDEFEAPIIEATNKVYYFFKSSLMIDLGLTEQQIKELLKGGEKYFELNYLKNLETSQLVVILKIYSILGVYQNIKPHKIKTIIDEIERRITSDGIKQYRDGFISSEATYFVLFCNYMRKNLKSLKDHDLLDKMVSRIYRNLSILDFSEDTNYDLVSELFYSCETLKLLNCIEKKQVIMHLAKYLFPSKVVDKILRIKEIVRTTSRLRYLHISPITGETIYQSLN
ncbi:MAG: hypothetical protein ACFFAN_08935 [Promethearchaeota archaeon]